jgi:RNA-directed DNA polymerase
MGGNRTSTDYINEQRRWDLMSTFDEYLVKSKLFLSIQNQDELIELLMLRQSDLLSIINNEYHEFEVRNRKGGIRRVQAPNESLKAIQDKLLMYLNAIHVTNFNDLQPHSFAYTKTISNKKPNQRSKNIVSNAQLHIEKKLVVNIDIMNFFNSITNTHLETLFKSYPFYFTDKISDLLIKIVSKNNNLPVGAPTSPVISNMIMLKLDQEFMNIPNVTYSRFSDDITFSTNRFEKNEVQLLINHAKETLTQYGFQMNPKKVKIMRNTDQQLVSGLIVNEKVNVPRTYIRKIKAIMHNVQVKGWSEAAIDYYNKNGRRSNFKKISNEFICSYILLDAYYSHLNINSFEGSLDGMINHVGYVRGKKDEVFLKLKDDFDALRKNIVAHEKTPVQKCFITKATAKNLMKHIYNFVILAKKLSHELIQQFENVKIDLGTITLENLDRDLLLQKKYIPQILTLMDKNDNYQRLIEHSELSKHIITRSFENKAIDEIEKSFYRRIYHLDTKCELLHQNFTRGSLTLKNSGVYYENEAKMTQTEKYLLTPDYLTELGMHCCKGCLEHSNS